MKRVALLAALLVLAAPVLGAPPENADPSLGPWFQGLKQPGTGASCCSLADCRPVDYRIAGDHYEALIQGLWRMVPADKVLESEPNPVGHAVVCYTPWQGILCFVPGTQA